MQLKRFFSLILLLSLALSSGCAQPKAAASGGLTVGSLWSAPAIDGVISWQSAYPMAIEQREGYLAGMKAASSLSPDSKESSEGNQEDDVQVTIRRMAEIDKDIAVIGATTNEAAMRAASLVNFFNMPMLVPTAYGDNLLPANNLWAFRLNAPGSAYAAYFFDTVLPAAAPAVSAAPAPTDTPSETPSALKIAILYEQNTFGESAAVAAAHGAMKQAVNIGLYANFNPSTPDPDRLKTQIDTLKTENVNLVYLISSDPQVALMLVRAIRTAYAPGAAPVLVGQAGGFATLDFSASADAEGVFVLSQMLDRSNCPSEVKSISQAQMYAAVSLLDQAVTQVKESSTSARSALSFKIRLPGAGSSTGSDASELTSLREKVRDTLKATNTKLPCLGKVAFDNSGLNKSLQFDLMLIHSGLAVSSSAEELKAALHLDAQTPPGGTPGSGTPAGNG